jgi:hypothetical protein
MRKFALAACAAALAILPAACSSDYRAKDEPPPGNAPVIKYSYIDSDDRALVAEYADRYCEEAYGKDAHELDTDREPGGYEVIYACR